MKKLIFIVFSLILLSCNKTSNFSENEKLNVSYAESIKFPTKNFDIIIFRPHIYECGNISENEMNTFYNPDLSKLPFKNIIKKKYNKQIFNEFEELKHLEKHKILYISVEGKIKTSKYIEINESYEYISNSKSEYFKINKKMILEKGGWKISIKK